MYLPESIINTALGVALKFLFEELKDIVTDIRARKKDEPVEKMNASLEQEPSEEFLNWVKDVQLGSNTAKEIKSLLELIEIERQNRRRARRAIALVGGEAFASPPQMVALESAEQNIIEHSKELKSYIETLYGEQIQISYLY
jgi:hypothetical protein